MMSRPVETPPVHSSRFDRPSAETSSFCVEETFKRKTTIGEEQMGRLSDTRTTTLIPPLTAVDALVEQLRQKLDVSWTCVDLWEGGGIMSYADREGLPLFGILDAANQHSSSSQTKHQPRAFAVPMMHASSVEDGAARIMQVYDTWQDNRFVDNVYVQSSPQRSYSVRFYAAMPIVQQGCDNGTARRQVIGTVGVCHHQPKHLTLDDKTLIENYAVKIGHLLSALVCGRSRGAPGSGVKRARKRSTSRDDSDIDRRNSTHAIISDGSFKSPFPKRRSASCGPPPLVSIVPETKAEMNVTSSSTCTAVTIIDDPFATKVPLPDPKTSTADPDEYLAQLIRALSSPSGTVQLQIKPSHGIVEYFTDVTEEQMARYNVNVVSMARNNDLAGIRELFAVHGRDALDCYNRFGEGLLTLACRRGFRDMVSFFLSDDVRLPVRVRDDYGRTPVHDACWHPAPQLEICTWIMARDPSLFLLADRRGFTAFQYARQSDWHIWRQFLFDHADRLRCFLTQQPDLVERFAAPNSK